MNKVFNILYSLQDPIHVERFQRFFGLKLISNDLKSTQYDPNKIQHLSSNGIKYSIDNYFWHYLFLIGSQFGYEPFYAFAFSFIYWNIDSSLSRRLNLVWAILMYCGQFLKEILKIPRPNNSKILVMESKYLNEYGMPSTHAMMAVLMPITIYYILIDRYQFSFLRYLMCSMIWCLPIFGSRLYLGMHSVLDLIVGIILSLILLIPMLGFLDRLDYYLVHKFFSPFLNMILIITLTMIYPESKTRSPSRAETVMIISAFSGIYLGSWINFKLGYIQYPCMDSSSSSLPIILSDQLEILRIIARTLIGCVTLCALKIFGSMISTKSIKRITGIDDFDRDGNKYKTSIEILTKLFTFQILGLGISFIVPMINRILSIERLTMIEDC